MSGRAALDPMSAGARLARAPGRVVLYSANAGSLGARWSFATAWPAATLTARGRQLEIRRGGDVEVVTGDPLEALATLADEFGAHDAVDDAAPVPVAIGFAGYELGEHIERIDAPPDRGGCGEPDLWFGFYGAVWRHDRDTDAGQVVGADAGARDMLRDALAKPAPPMAPPVLGELVPDPGSRERYERGFARVHDYIRAGDVYQVNLARRLRAPIVRPGDSLAILRAVAHTTPAPFAALIETEQAVVISASPERFLTRAPGESRLETRPIKGTRRRTKDAARDRELREELLADDKERAEHLMIVDLLRNDLGRVARSGTVEVDRFAELVALPTLYHLVSTVSCQVRPGVGIAELMRATFPGGSITGAPKIRAMQIIAELEPVRRGVYTGAIGYLARGGGIEFSIAIRTGVLCGGALSLHSGGGVVADSACDREWEETEEKAAAWHSAVESLSRLA